jgi:hypothetical protein
MARPRKPTAELELKGAFKKDPKRKRVDPKTSGPVGDPPPSLSLELHATWYELAEQAPINVLRSADRALLGIAATLLYKIRKTSLDDLEPAMIGQLIKCLSAMGMTPVDRSKVHAPQEKVENPFAKFASKAAEARKPVH